MSELRSVVGHDGGHQDGAMNNSSIMMARRSGGAGGPSLMSILIQGTMFIFFLGCATYGTWMVDLRAEQRLEDFKTGTMAALNADNKLLRESLATAQKELTELRQWKSHISLTIDDMAKRVDTTDTDDEALSKRMKKLATKIEDLEDIVADKVDQQAKEIGPLKEKVAHLEMIEPKVKFEQIDASLNEIRQKLPGGGAAGAGNRFAPLGLNPQGQTAAALAGGGNGDQWRQQKAETDFRMQQELERNQQRIKLEEDRHKREAEQRERMIAESTQVGAGARARGAMKPKVRDEVAELEDGPGKSDLQKDAVKKAFLDGWNTYKKYAWGHDEVKPVSQRAFDWTFRSEGLGLTIIDSLDTLLLMELDDEFQDALEWVKSDFNIDQHIRVSAFEMTIRIIGGLLSAFELSGEKHKFLVKKAQYVMNKLLVAYNTSSGVPHQTVDLKELTHWSPEWTGRSSVLSEYGSVQLELRTLSFHTKNPLYDMKGTHLMSIIESRCEERDYLCPTYLDINTVRFTDDHVTMGALGDSFYEYLLKQYLLTGKTEKRYYNMAKSALEAGVNKLIRYSNPNRLTYLVESEHGGEANKMDELACFAGGMYALASKELEDSGMEKTFMKIAKGLTKTCYEMFRTTNTGLAAESVDFRAGHDFVNGPEFYLLRPETSETLFYMWRITKDKTYRDWQWEIFTHLREHCHVATGGFSGIKTVSIIPPELDDQQQSFLLAETFKYMYLTFADDNAIDLDQWVFNTEAHPLKIRERDPLDIWRQWEDKHDGLLPWYPPTLKGIKEIMTKKGKLYMEEEGPITAPKDPKAVAEPPNEDEVARMDADRAVQQEQDEKRMADIQRRRAETIAKEQAQIRMRAQKMVETEKRRRANARAEADFDAPAEEENLDARQPDGGTRHGTEKEAEKDTEE